MEGLTKHPTHFDETLMISKETGIKQTSRNLHFGFSTLGEAISKSLIRVLVLNMSLKLRIRL